MPDDKTIDFVLAFVSIGVLTLGLGSMLLGWLAAKWERLVNRFVDVMSRAEDEPPQNVAPSLRTDDRTDDRTPPITGKQLLTLYRLMRAHGITREDASAALRASGLPFSSDVWRDAAPPPPQHLTPIASRPTDAAFADPDYPYQPLS